MNNNTNLQIDPMTARRLALAEARIDSAIFTFQKLLWENGRPSYVLDFITDSMNYTCYIDAETGFVPGFDCSPRPVDFSDDAELSEGKAA